MKRGQAASKIFDIPTTGLTGTKFPGIDEQDPSLQDNFKLMFEDTFEFQLVVEGKKITEKLRVRIFDQYNDHKILEHLKIELSSHTDLYLHFIHLTNDDTFLQMKDMFNWHIEYPQFPDTCVKIFKKLYEKGHYASMSLQSDGSALISILEEGDYNVKELIQLEFYGLPDERLKVYIGYRVLSLKHRLSVGEERLSDVQNILRIRDPQLYQEVITKIMKQKR